MARVVIGFVERIQPARDLVAGTRVVWFGGTFRVVDGISEILDGSGHLRVAYADGTSTRYAGHGLVRCLDLAPVEVPA